MLSEMHFSDKLKMVDQVRAEYREKYPEAGFKTQSVGRHIDVTVKASHFSARGEIGYHRLDAVEDPEAYIRQVFEHCIERINDWLPKPASKPAES